MAKLGESASGRVISASMVQGTPVCNAEGKKLGTVEDIMIDKLSGQVRYAVLGFGGFLGMGEKDVALPLSKINVTKDENNAMKLTIQASREELDAAPAFDKTLFLVKTPAPSSSTTTQPSTGSSTRTPASPAAWSQTSPCPA